MLSYCKSRACFSAVGTSWLRSGPRSSGSVPGTTVWQRPCGGCAGRGPQSRMSWAIHCTTAAGSEFQSLALHWPTHTAHLLRQPPVSRLASPEDQAPGSARTGGSQIPQATSTRSDTDHWEVPAMAASSRVITGTFAKRSEEVKKGDPRSFLG